MPKKVIRILKGKRFGQTKISKRKRTYVIKGKRVTIPAGYYVKGGKLIKYSKKRDWARIAKHKRGRKQAPWRGDLPRSAI